MPTTLGEIADLIGAELDGDPATLISGVATLINAEEGHISFLSNRRYRSHLESTRASAVILAGEDKSACPVSSLVVGNPYLSYARVVSFLYPEPAFTPGVHELASVSATASIHPGAGIGAHAHIGDNVKIHENVFIGPGCVLEEDVSVGSNCRLTANVTLCRGTILGERVRIHPGVVLGADGFGIANDGGQWLKIPQLGKVVIGNDVEIGANTTIDRGALEDTVIEDGVKIDNQVQIGHNVTIGAHTAIAGCVGIAGSTHIGRRCMIGGGAGISGHIEIGDDVIITAFSGVANSLAGPGVYSGAMASTDNKTWRKNIARFKHLDELARRLKRLEEKFDK